MNRCRHIARDLAALGSGGLDAERRREVERHLEACPECRAEAAEIGKALAAARQAAAPPGPAYWATILPRVHERLERKKTGETPGMIARLAFPVVASVAFLCVAVQRFPASLVASPGDVRSVVSGLPAEDVLSFTEQSESGGGADPVAQAAPGSSWSEDSEIMQAILAEVDNPAEFVDEGQPPLEGLSAGDIEKLVSILQQPAPDGL